MRLDHTRIVIAERSQPEILDLTFLVLRAFFLPVLSLVLVLAIPLAVLNDYLIQWMAADLVEDLTVARYLWTMAILVYVEAPLAGVLATAYLGKATFYEAPPMRELIYDVLRVAHRIAWTHLVLRGVLLVIYLVWSIEQGDRAGPVEWLFLPMICCVLFLWRSLRPYINEIIVLERSPIRSNDPSQITVAKRSGRLHGPNSGDLFGRGLAMIIVVGTLGLAVFGSMWFAIATFTNDWSWGPVIVHVAIPATYWALVVYVTVFRFLSYLDLRIRREGWEVELKMRAEANRLAERLALGSA